jgi:hypothetical protein
MSDAIVSYMYRELAPAERTAFEDHLAKCPMCIDEFAEVADARFSVYEWRHVEFESLPTPEIVIPYNAPAHTHWFRKLREAFSASPGWPAIGFSSAVAAVLLAIGFAGYQLRSGGDDVASNISDVVPIASAPAQQPENAAVPTDTARTEPVKEAETLKRTVSPVLDSTGLHAVQATATGAAKTVHKTRPVRRTERPVRAVEFRREPDRLPTFTEFADQEDETLRLAELFDDIETSE